MELKIYSKDGSSSKSKKVDGFMVLEGEKGRDALSQVIVAYQANARQGNASTKDYGEVSGSGKKLYRQKGTGRARPGSKGSPIRVGGGVIFGPHPRDYSQKINAKVKRLALHRALFDYASNGNMDLIEGFAVNAPKTKEINGVLSRIHPKGKILLIDNNFDQSVLLAARNLGRAFIMGADSVNAWDVLRCEKILITEEGLNTLLARSVNKREKKEDK